MKRWIRFNNEEQIVIPKTYPKFLLTSFDTKIDLEYKSFSDLFEKIRPSCSMQKKLGRYCKDIVYKTMANHCEKAKIKGSYAGLPANYISEILFNFHPYLNNNFYVFENRKSFAKNLEEYRDVMSCLLPKYFGNLNIDIVYGDIIEQLHKLDSKISILDLDLMESLETKTRHTVKETVDSISSCLDSSSVVTIWQTVGRAGATDKEMKETIRPLLKKNLKEKFNIKRHDQIDYWEGYPMRCDVFTLEKY